MSDQESFSGKARDKLISEAEKARQQIEVFARKTQSELRQRQRELEGKIKAFGADIKDRGTKELDAVLDNIRSQEFLKKPGIRDLMEQVDKLQEVSNDVAKTFKERAEQVTPNRVAEKVKKTGEQVTAESRELLEKVVSDELITQVAQVVADQAQKIRQGILDGPAEKVKSLKEKVSAKPKKKAKKKAKKKVKKKAVKKTVAKKAKKKPAAKKVKRKAAAKKTTVKRKSTKKAAKKTVRRTAR